MKPPPQTLEGGGAPPGVAEGPPLPSASPGRFGWPGSSDPPRARAICTYAAAPPLAGLLEDASCTWPILWDRLQRELHRRGYRRGTRTVYRQVLRGLARACDRPAAVGPEQLAAHLYGLAGRHRSASWLAANICVLRTVFDTLGGRDWLARRRGPRRPHCLPRLLNRGEAAAVLRAAGGVRDAMLLGLLYGCGLKVGELRALRWGDVDMEAGTLTVLRPDHGTRRVLALPGALRGYFQAGAAQFSSRAWIFPGRSGARPLSIRRIERIVAVCAARAGLEQPVNPMTLRHSHAVHALEDGCNVRALQEALGHRSLETTLRYLEYLLPEGFESPLDRLGADASAEAAEELAEEFGERHSPPWHRLARALRRARVSWKRLRGRGNDPPG